MDGIDTRAGRESRIRFGDIVKTVITLVMGAIITLLLSNVAKIDSNTERIARIEAIIEPLKNVSADIAWLKANAERNVSTLDRIEKKVDAHVAEKQ
jgi:hypothetical protein